MPDVIVVAPTALVPVARPALPDVETLLAGRLAASSLVGYRRNIAAYVAWCQVQGLVPTEPRSLAAWRTDQVTATTHSAATINRAMAAVKRLVKESAAQDYLSAEIAAKFAAVDGVSARALKTRMRAHNKTYISTEEMRRLVDAPDATTPLGQRDRALLAVMATSGVRIAEAVGLRWADITERAGSYTIQVRGKTDTEPRTAMLGTEAYRYLCTWIATRGWQEGWVFTSTRGHGRQLERTPISTAAGWLVFQRAADTAGLSHIKCHDARRFFVTQMIQRESIEVARQAAGHKSIETTSRYNLNAMPVGRSNDLF